MELSDSTSKEQTMIFNPGILYYINIEEDIVAILFNDGLKKIKGIANAMPEIPIGTICYLKGEQQ